MNNACNGCLIIHCSYEPFSEACQSAREFSKKEFQEIIDDKLYINRQREISSNIFAKQFMSD